MHQMNLGGSSENSLYPFLKETANGCSLGIGPGYHVLRRGNQYILATTEDGHDIGAKSTNNLNVVSEFLSGGEDDDFLSQLPTTVLDSICLSYVLEVAANLPEFWNLVIVRPELLEGFMANTLRQIDLQECLKQVKPIDAWPVGMRFSQDKVVISLSTLHGVEPVGLLRFGTRSVQFDTQFVNGTLQSTFIRFPEFSMLDEPTLSRRDYYFLMWSRLFLQLLAASGIYVSELGIGCIGEMPFAAYHWDGKGVKPMRVRYLDEIYKAITEYVNWM